MNVSSSCGMWRFSVAEADHLQTLISKWIASLFFRGQCVDYVITLIINTNQILEQQVPDSSNPLIIFDSPYWRSIIDLLLAACSAKNRSTILEFCLHSLWWRVNKFSSFFCATAFLDAHSWRLLGLHEVSVVKGFIAQDLLLSTTKKTKTEILI